MERNLLPFKKLSFVQIAMFLWQLFYFAGFHPLSESFNPPGIKLIKLLKTNYILLLFIIGLLNI
jgi:hypothetical protein